MADNDEGARGDAADLPDTTIADAAVLDISTLVSRPQIKIDGVLHDIVSPEELPLLTGHRLAALGRNYERLIKTDTLGDAQARRLLETLNEQVDIIAAPVPAEVRARLSDQDKVAIVEAFTLLLLARRARLAGAAAKGMAGAAANRK